MNNASGDDPRRHKSKGTGKPSLRLFRKWWTSRGQIAAYPLNRTTVLQQQHTLFLGEPRKRAAVLRIPANEEVQSEQRYGTRIETNRLKCGSASNNTASHKNAQDEHLFFQDPYQPLRSKKWAAESPLLNYRSVGKLRLDEIADSPVNLRDLPEAIHYLNLRDGFVVGGDRCGLSSIDFEPSGDHLMGIVAAA